MMNILDRKMPKPFDVERPYGQLEAPSSKTLGTLVQKLPMKARHKITGAYRLHSKVPSEYFMD